MKTKGTGSCVSIKNNQERRSVGSGCHVHVWEGMRVGIQQQLLMPCMNCVGRYPMMSAVARIVGFAPGQEWLSLHRNYTLPPGISHSVS